MESIQVEIKTQQSKLGLQIAIAVFLLWVLALATMVYLTSEEPPVKKSEPILNSES